MRVVMRRLGRTTVVASILALTLIFVVAGCDYDGAPASEVTSTSAPQMSQPKPLSNDPTDMLEAIVDASEGVLRYTFSFQVDVQMTLDPEGMTAEDAMFMGILQGPLTMSGDVSIDEEAGAASADLTFGMAGITYSMSLRALDGESYVSILGRWYDLTPLMEEQEGEDFSQSPDLEAIETRIAVLRIKPLAWLGDVELVGDETIDGVDTYHLECSPDLDLILEDVLVLLGDEKLMEMIDPTGELSALLDEDMLSEADLLEMRTGLPEMVSEFTVDLWAGKDDSTLRKAEVSMRLAPPAGEPSEGIEGIDVRAQITLYDLGEPVEVEAPEDALPFTELETMLEDMFGTDSLMPLDEQLDEPTRS